MRPRWSFKPPWLLRQALSHHRVYEMLLEAMEAASLSPVPPFFLFSFEPRTL